MNLVFPEKYHGVFDVVHIRHVTVALTIDQIPGFMKNVMMLLSEFVFVLRGSAGSC